MTRCRPKQMAWGLSLHRLRHEGYNSINISQNSKILVDSDSAQKSYEAKSIFQKLEFFDF